MVDQFVFLYTQYQKYRFIQLANIFEYILYQLYLRIVGNSRRCSIVAHRWSQSRFIQLYPEIINLKSWLSSVFEVIDSPELSLYVYFLEKMYYWIWKGRVDYHTPSDKKEDCIQIIYHVDSMKIRIRNIFIITDVNRGSWRRRLRP